MAQNDVANKAIEANTQKYASVTMNARPGGSFTTHTRDRMPEAPSPSGLNQKYTDRFTENC